MASRIVLSFSSEPALTIEWNANLGKKTENVFCASEEFMNGEQDEIVVSSNLYNMICEILINAVEI